MQITLKQAHIEAAIRDYVAKAGITFPVDSIDFTASRGKDGMTATVEMEDPFLIDPTPVAPPKAVKAVASPKRETRDEPAAEAEQEEATPDQAFVADEEEETPVAEDASPFKSDAPVAAAAKEETTQKAGVSLFG